MNSKTSKKETLSRREQQNEAYHIGIVLSPIQRRNNEKKDDKLFKSGKVKAHYKRQSGISDKGVGKLSNKVMTTDESNNGIDSKLHESTLFNQHNTPNEEYFHQPLVFKSKKQRKQTQPCKRQSRLVQISVKIEQMTKMVYSQEKQIKEMRASMSQKQIGRLMKIHSIEKLKLMTQMKSLKSNSIRSSKKL